MNEAISTKLKIWAASTTCHGVGRIIAKSNLSVKILRVVIFEVALCYLIYLLVNIFTAYLSYSVVVTISIKRDHQIDFPTVTFCNLNPFNTQSPHFYLRNLEADLKELMSNNKTKLLTTLYNIGNTFYKSSPYWPDYNKTEAEIKLLGFNINDMLISCLFNNIPCNSDDFVEVWTYEHGRCYKFNSGITRNGENVSIKTTKNSGQYFALKLELFVGYSADPMDFTKSKGARVYVHNPSYVPNYDKEGISVSTGTETNAIIVQKNYNRLSFPYSNCIVNVTSSEEYASDLYRETVLYFGMYSQKYCIIKCYNNYIFEKCGCNSPEFFKFGDKHKISTLADAVCVNNHTTIFYNNNEVMAKCYSQCPQECFVIEYDLSSSISEYPTQFYANMLKNYFSHLDKSQYPSNFYNFTDSERIIVIKKEIV